MFYGNELIPPWIKHIFPAAKFRKFGAAMISVIVNPTRWYLRQGRLSYATEEGSAIFHVILVAWFGGSR